MGLVQRMRANNKSIQDTIYSWEGWFFNLACALYFWLLSPVIVAATKAAMQDDDTVFIPWLGVVLVVVSILEIYAFPEKMKYVHRAAKEHGEQIGTGWFLWMFHMAISVLMAMLVFESFGFEIPDPDNSDEKMSGWMMLVIFIVVIKELYFLFCIMGLHGDDDPLEGYERPNKKEWILDLILLAYACIAYTTTWESIASGVNMEKGNTAIYVVNLFGAGILFLMFYLPIRIPYYLEEMSQLKTNGDILKFLLGIGVVMVVVLGNL